MPIWKGAGVLRSELNEPRWAAAPRTWFDSDPSGADGLYRLMVDSAYTELSVSFQAPTDLSTPTSADRIYFGFTTDGLTAALAKGFSISVSNSGSTDPADAVAIQEYAYNGATWATPLGAPPSWLVSPSAWRNNGQHDAAWGINFKINLGTAGLSASTPFKIFFGLHKEDEANSALSVNLSSPSPVSNSLVTGTLFIADPAQWATAAPINSGCPGGITLSSAQIGTRSSASGSPTPTIIDTTNGVVNHFFVTPTIPSDIALSLSPGEFQASFHLSNWSAVAAPDAPWSPLPNGTAVGNGISPASNKYTIEFACPPNTATTTCGIPTPTQAQQSVYVELRESPTNTVALTKAAAYVDMEFKCLGCPAAGGSGGSGTSGSGGSAGGASTTGGIANGGTGAPEAGASGTLENAAGEAGSEAASGAGGAVSGGATAAGGKPTGDAGASPVSAGAGGTPGNPSSSADKSGCNCTVSGAPNDYHYGALTLLALIATLARRRRAEPRTLGPRI